MDIRIVSSLDDVGLDERGWNDLVHQSDTDTVFQTHQWTRSWLEAFGCNGRPLFVTVNDKDGVKAVAPMVTDVSGAEGHDVRFLGDGRADYCDFIAGRDKSEAISLLLGAILRCGPRILELNNVPERSQTPRLAREVCRAQGYHVLVERQYLCPRLVIDGNLETAKRIRDKASLRRRERLLQRRGRLVVHHQKAGGEIEPRLDQFFAQHIARWAGSVSPSLFLKAPNRAFYRALAASLSDEGWLLFTTVELDGQPIAFHYGFDYQGAVLWYKPSFERAHASASPGLVLIRTLIGYAIEHGRREVDFTIGNEPFKARFTNSLQATQCVTAFRNSLAWSRARARRRVMRIVKGWARWPQNRNLRRLRLAMTARRGWR